MLYACKCSAAVRVYFKEILVSVCCQRSRGSLIQHNKQHISQSANFSFFSGKERIGLSLARVGGRGASRRGSRGGPADGAAVKYDENQDERRDSLPIYSGNQRLVCLRRPLLQVRATAGRHEERSGRRKRKRSQKRRSARSNIRTEGARRGHGGGSVREGVGGGGGGERNEEESIRETRERQDIKGEEEERAQTRQGRGRRSGREEGIEGIGE